MEELLELYEELDVAVPVDIQTKAIDTYGFILEDNYPQENMDG
jgi:hypothetical protein